MENLVLWVQIRQEKLQIGRGEIALKILESTRKKLGDCHETGLLWKHPTAKLPNNCPIAENHLRSLKRRLAKNTALATAYQSTIDNDLEKGYIKKLTPEKR